MRDSVLYRSCNWINTPEVGGHVGLFYKLKNLKNLFILVHHCGGGDVTCKRSIMRLRPHDCANVTRLINNRHIPAILNLSFIQILRTQPDI